MEDDVLRKLQAWYESQCNGDWEHGNGIEIGTLDNPGWRVTIYLEGTSLEDQFFQEVSDLEPERDWIRCWAIENKFEGRGGPKKLQDILRCFLQWALKKDRPVE